MKPDPMVDDTVVFHVYRDFENLQKPVPDDGPVAKVVDGNRKFAL